jgi:hypothetical protein
MPLQSPAVYSLILYHYCYQQHPRQLTFNTLITLICHPVPNPLT